MAATPMEGKIAVTFRREPSWFGAAVVDGTFHQTLACRELDSGQIVGLACRSIRDVFVNGKPAEIGYLSGLRFLPAHRNLGLVARGFAAMKELHGDARTPYYLTTIAEGNETALKVLTSGRARLPAYHPAGAYHTVAIALSRREKRRETVGVRPANQRDLPAVLNFLNAEGPRRQFFPRLTEQDFLSADGILRDLFLDNLLLAERAGRLVGTLAGWDQHGFRQSVVQGYRGWLRAARPIYNAWQWLCNRHGLPAPGLAFRYRMGALPVVANNDEEVFAALLKALRDRSAGGPWSYLLVGLHERDPLLPVVCRLQTTSYVTRLFLVCWKDGETARAEIDSRVPYLEAGSL